MASTFTLFQGDSVVLQIPIYSSGTTPATLIAPTGAYAIAQSNTSGVTLISKTGVLTQSGGLWTMAVTLTSADTASLPPGTLYQQATVLDTDGSAETVLAAPIVVNAALSLTAISGAASTASTAALVALLLTPENLLLAFSAFTPAQIAALQAIIGTSSGGGGGGGGTYAPSLDFSVAANSQYLPLLFNPLG